MATVEELLADLAKATEENKRLQAELAEQRLLNDSYAAQVSLDFEELTWLRTLAEYIELCDVTNDLNDVMRIVLPRLRQIIVSEALAFLPVEPDGVDDAGRSGRVGSPSFWAGRRVIDDRTCSDLVGRFRETSAQQTVVKNNMHLDDELKCYAGLKSCVIVQVSKSDFVAGWLIALNRLGDEVSTPADDSNGESLGWDMEFGTFEAGLLAAASVMLSTHARNIHLFREQENLLVGVIRALVNAMDAKDSYTCGHSDRVALMARRLGEELGMDSKECEQLYMTGLLHDVGKIGVPDEVLNKPGRLTTEELELIKQHPVIGYRILKHLRQFNYVLPGVLHHHEAVDGSGYPHGLMDEAIPVSARILAVVDAFDAMTSCRPYRDAMPTEKAESILLKGAGTQWDARSVDAFFSALDDMHQICAASYEHTRSLLAAEEPDSTTFEESRSDSITTAVTATHQ